MEDTINIVVPMAGAGSRFAEAGYSDPKPLIPVHGVPMIRLVIENIRPAREHRFIFICQQCHRQKFDLEQKLSSWAPGSVIVSVVGLTEGAACTVLSVREMIDNDAPLMIANSDQLIDASIDDYLDHFDADYLDGLIMTMQACDNKWSYAGVDDTGRVVRVVEKKVISNHATVGIYNFRRGRDFVAAADLMIAQDQRVNGEFYVAPTYNALCGDHHIGVYSIGRPGDGMYGLGTPRDLDMFLGNPILRNFVAGIV